MLNLKTLKFKNIGRFTEEQTIYFDNLGSFVQVDAQNNNTGGSSGSGKSTIFNALDWLLGLSDLSANVLQSRLTKEHLFVAAQFDWDGKEIIISRSKKLSIIIDGVETSGSSKITEELLDQIIGMPRSLFRPLLHKRQGETGFFLQMSPSQMNTFLTDCTGLSTITNKVALIEQKIKDIFVLKTQFQGELQASQAVLEANKWSVEALGQEPKNDLTLELIEAYRVNYESSKSSLLEKQVLYDKEKVLLNEKKPQFQISVFDKSYLNKIESEIKDLENQINSILENEKDRKSKIDKEINKLRLEINNQISDIKIKSNSESSLIKNEILKLTNHIKLGDLSKIEATKITNQIKTLKSGICHICEQSWITEKSKTEEKRLLEELNKHKTTIEFSIQSNKEIENLKNRFLETTSKYTAEIYELESKLSKDITYLDEKSSTDEASIKLQPLNEKLREFHEIKIKEQEKESLHDYNQNLSNNTKISLFLLEKEVLDTKYSKEIKELTNELEKSRNQYESSDMSFKTQEKELSKYVLSLKNLKEKEDSTNLKVVHMTSKIGQLNKEISIAEEVKRCLKSYLSCSFEDSLGYISDTATKLLRSIPTMSNATIRLESLKETVSGAIKEQINANLDNDGEIDVSIKSLSGGERSAVDLAVDLAVNVLIQEKSNSGINILELDECFGGFDSVGIENALEMLRTFSLDKKILIVEHDSIAKEFIQNKITVVREGEISYIKNNN